MRKLHIGIDARTLKIRTVPFTTTNVSDSQILGDLLDQIPLEEQIDSVYKMGLMTRNTADRRFP